MLYTNKKLTSTLVELKHRLILTRDEFDELKERVKYDSDDFTAELLINALTGEVSIQVWSRDEDELHLVISYAYDKLMSHFRRTGLLTSRDYSRDFFKDKVEGTGNYARITGLTAPIELGEC